VLHPLDSARERLKRADENIQQLNGRITDFLAPVPAITLDVDVAAGQPIITDENRKAYDKLVDFIKGHKVEPRFSVLAGEIIHHLRSAFDHLTWQLSSPDVQAKSGTQIEFPVFRERPQSCSVAKRKICRYCRKVEGVASPSALTRIQRLQPYHRADPSRHPLWLIHDLDRIDKHRELVLAVYIMRLDVAATAQANGIGIQMPWELRPRIIGAISPPRNVEMKVKMSAQVTLGEFRGREDKPIIPTLQDLLDFTVNSIEGFAGEFA